MIPKNLFVILLFCLVVRAIFTMFIEIPNASPFFLDLIFQCGMYLLLFILCVQYLKLNRSDIFQIFGTKPKPIFVLMATCWALVLLMFTLGENAFEALLLSQFNKAMAYRVWNFHENSITTYPFFSRQVLSFLFVTVGVGPIVEEFFFRGLLLPALSIKRGFHASAIISSVFFVALHFSTHYFLSTFVFSISLCYIYLVSRSLIACAIIHISFNFVAFLHQNYFDIHWTRSINEMDSLIFWIPQLIMFAVSVLLIFYAGYFFKDKILKSCSTTFCWHSIGNKS